MRLSFPLASTFLLLATVMAQQSSESRSTVYIPNGFLSGRQFLEMNKNDQRKYSMGIVDGILVSPLVFVDGKPAEDLHKCVAGMDEDQIATLITRRLQEHPEVWHQRVHVQAILALKSACPNFALDLDKK